MAFTPRSQPYRIDYNGNPESLGQVFRDTDEMFQNLFDDLKSTFGAIGAVGVDYQAWDANLDALSAMVTTGVMVRTASEVYATRTITAGTGITVTNGDGISGNPTIALSGSAGVSLAQISARVVIGI